MFELPTAAARPSAALEPCPLTDKELQALRGLAEGKVYKEIAVDLGIATSTVRSHLHKTYKKVGASDRAQAVLIATERGWLYLSPAMELQAGRDRHGRAARDRTGAGPAAAARARRAWRSPTSTGGRRPRRRRSTTPAARSASPATSPRGRRRRARRARRGGLRARRRLLRQRRRRHRHRPWRPTDATWDLAFGVNIRAHVLAAKRLLPGWLERGDGYFARHRVGRRPAHARSARRPTR